MKIKSEVQESEAGGYSCEFASIRGEHATKSETQLHTFEGDKPETRNQKPETSDQRLVTSNQYTWSGVEPQPYKLPSEDWARVVRHVIVGNQGEETKSHLRYFEIAPGGYTSLEKHEHAHVVIGIRGKGQVVAGTECYELNFLDTLYIAPNTPHQLINGTDKPFGFFCIVDAERDQPQALSEEEVGRIKANPRTCQTVKF